MKILSIAWIGSPSTAALIIDGEITSCVSEERFSRIKNDESYPLKSIEEVLRMGGIKPQELDLVVVPGERFDPLCILSHKLSRFSVQDSLKEQNSYWYPKLYQQQEIFYLDVFKDKIDTKQYPGNWEKVIRFLKTDKQDDANRFFKDFRKKTISSHLGIDPKKIIFVHHHRSHAYYAYYASPIRHDNTLILTADAWGDDANATVSLVQKGKINLLSSSPNFNLGRIYRYITLLLGMKPGEHEYKVMGLAAYAKQNYYRYALEVFRKTMYVDGLGFDYHERPPDLYFYFKNKLEGNRFDSIAGALQEYTEEIMTQWSRNALKATGAERICLGGGVAMNIKAALKISKLPWLKEIFICPSPSDESLAIGAAYAVMYDRCILQNDNPVDYLKPLKNAYLGPSLTQKDVDIVIKEARRKKYSLKKEPSLKYVAGLIAEGKIIGRCVGKSEFGARALGNRSILADPRNHSSIRIINEKIKNRDFWMPFAPSILEEQASKYLINPKKLRSSYMTIAFESTLLAQRDLKAALHPYDFTVRPHTVNKETNSAYYNLITEFYKSTGVAGVLNTSFNIHGEPIVQSARDAFDVFEKTGLDALLLEDYLIERKRKNGK